MTDCPQTDRCPSRRQLLQGTVAIAGTGAALALVGCADDGAGAAPTPTPTGPPVEVPKAKVPVGGGVVLERRYVVTQPSTGEYHAFTKVCPHGGCAVSFVKNQQIVCACHGSEFSITDGARTAGPARKGLTAAPVTESGDNLVIG
ncbi:Rieske (2Fe-2S) protein [Naumannella sp. ID2617S]|nr:Rieske (2Fe-2S) protein [Naumannella sp. ID2617S]